ncbi:MULTISPECIES: hypothetical protein [Flavobacteriaceae]|uniref:Uncharacterized protein n=2 Tax=Flavobacteriaceae TaxID=49546 RepID=A0A4Y8APW5_9FLAO|nr:MULTISPECIES: hypothetical protein [Flavobacteriaceae]TEW71845.1 hypothetical protein E2488_15365 [Gramella jeungdoensis]GGK60301.1 hypothetical protein GCM10007963_30480 [Lutibacter litoralis]
MKFILILFLLLTISWTSKNKSKKIETIIDKTENFIAVLDTIWQTEQIPIRSRDLLIRICESESKEYIKQQLIYEKNHIINKKK